MSITILIIIATAITSFAAFSKQELIEKLIFYPPAVSERKEWYRFFSCGLIHADMGHLIFNMITLYLFGEGQNQSGVEYMFIDIFGSSGKFYYLLMYVLALAVCLLPTYEKNKHNYYYRSLGASGAVSAVVFASIMLNPLGGIGLFFIPALIYSFIFGALYLYFSYYLDKKGGDNINHSAHLWGGLFGVLFMLTVPKIANNYPVLSNFIEQLTHFRIQDIIRFQS